MTIDTLDLGMEHLEVLETIGRGGFSVVYRATDTRLRRPVAVKVLTGITSEADLDRFDLECQIHGPLSAHPNIVTIHDAGTTPSGSPFLVMEYLDQGSLADHLERRGPIGWHQVVEWMIPVSRAVAAAHARGVLHRDIKPANVLLSADGPKLADFGIACGSDATSPQFAVSWLHAPPEAEANRRDERSDVYSLASTAHQLLTGRAPFQTDSDDSLPALLRRIVDQPAPRLGPDVAPRWLDDLLQAGLAKDPAARPPSAEAFAQALAAGPQAQASNRPAPVAVAAPAPVAQPTIVSPMVGTAPTSVLAAQPHPHAISQPGTVVLGGQPHPHAISQPGTVVLGGRPQRERRGAAAPILAVAALAVAIAGLLLGPGQGVLDRALGTGTAGAGTEEATGTPDETPVTSIEGPGATTPTGETTAATDTTVPTTETTDTTTPTSETTETTPSTDTTVPTTETTETTDGGGDTTEPPVTDGEVPDVAGRTSAEAATLLADAGFDTVQRRSEPSADVAEGIVIGTDPPAGTVADLDATVTLRVSSGPELVIVPDLAGLSRAAAEQFLADTGLTAVVTTVEVPEDSGQVGVVLGSDPFAGSEVPVGSTVEIAVGVAEPAPIPTIPPVIGTPGG